MSEGDLSLQAQALGQRAAERFAEGARSAAVTLLDQAIALANGGVDDEPLLLMDLLAMHCDLQRLAGRYQSADASGRRALAIAEAQLAPDDPELAQLLNMQGMICKYLARHEEGLGHYRRALAILEGREEQETRGLIASIYHNIGGIEHAAGRFARAEPAARAGVALREQLAAGGDHARAELAADLAALGAIVEERGRLDEAEALYRRARRIHQRMLEPDERELGYLAHALGSVAQRRGAWTKAAALYDESLTLKRRHLGHTHPSVAITLNNLGLVWQELEDPRRARACYREALEVFAHEYASDHPDVRACRDNLAGCPVPSSASSA